MRYIIFAVISYLVFNLAIYASLGQGGLLALAAANFGGGIATLGWFWTTQVRGKGAPRFVIAALGALGVLAIVVGIRGAQSALPVSLAMEAVYNGFAITSWPLFLLLGWAWPTKFQDRPGWFDLGCHGAMAALVALRFGTYAQEVTLTTWAAGSVALAVGGYAAFNVAIKLAAGHRATNIAMNFIAATLLAGYAWIIGDSGHWAWSVSHIGGALLGMVAIFGIVWSLGAAYGDFVPKKLGALVAPLVYDGILVASPLVMCVTGELLSVWTLVLAAGMLAVTVVRYRHHTR
jgi:hypothetical protein